MDWDDGFELDSESARVCLCATLPKLVKDMQRLIDALDSQDARTYRSCFRRMRFDATAVSEVIPFIDLATVADGLAPLVTSVNGLVDHLLPGESFRKGLSETFGMHLIDIACQGAVLSAVAKSVLETKTKPEAMAQSAGSQTSAENAWHFALWSRAGTRLATSVIDDRRRPVEEVTLLTATPKERPFNGVDDFVFQMTASRHRARKASTILGRATPAGFAAVMTMHGAEIADQTFEGSARTRLALRASTFASSDLRRFDTETRDTLNLHGVEVTP